MNCDLMTPIISREYYEMPSTLKKFNSIMHLLRKENLFHWEKGVRKKQEIQETFATYSPFAPTKDTMTQE